MAPPRNLNHLPVVRLAPPPGIVPPAKAPLLRGQAALPPNIAFKPLEPPSVNIAKALKPLLPAEDESQLPPVTDEKHKERLQKLNMIRDELISPTNLYQLNADEQKDLTTVINTLTYIVRDIAAIKLRTGEPITDSLTPFGDKKPLYATIHLSELSKNPDDSEKQLIGSLVDVFIKSHELVKEHHKAPGNKVNIMRIYISKMNGICIDARLRMAFDFVKKMEMTLLEFLNQATLATKTRSDETYFGYFKLVLDTCWGLCYREEKSHTHKTSTQVTSSGTFNFDVLPKLKIKFEELLLKPDDSFLTVYENITPTLLPVFLKFILLHENLLDNSLIPEEIDLYSLYKDYELEIKKDEKPVKDAKNIIQTSTVNQFQFNKLLLKTDWSTYTFTTDKSPLITLLNRAHIETCLRIFKQFNFRKLLSLQDHQIIISLFTNKLQILKKSSPGLVLTQINMQLMGGNTLLHLAIEYNVEKAVSTLIKLGSDPYIKNHTKQTPLELLALDTTTLKTFKSALTATQEKIIHDEKGAPQITLIPIINVNTRFNVFYLKQNNDLTLFHWVAMIETGTEKIEFLLNLDDFDHEIVESLTDFIGLHEHNEKIFSLLSSPNIQFRTAINKIKKNKPTEAAVIITDLYRAGGDISELFKKCTSMFQNNEKSLHLFAQTLFERSAILACEKNHIQFIEELIQAYPLPTTSFGFATTHGDTLLHTAVIHQRPISLLTSLVKKGSSLCKPNNEYHTPVSLAAKLNRWDIVEKFAETKPEQSTSPQFGYTLIRKIFSEYKKELEKKTVLFDALAYKELSRENFSWLLEQKGVDANQEYLKISPISYCILTNDQRGTEALLMQDNIDLEPIDTFILNINDKNFSALCLEYDAKPRLAKSKLQKNKIDDAVAILCEEYKNNIDLLPQLSIVESASNYKEVKQEFIKKLFEKTAHLICEKGDNKALSKLTSLAKLPSETLNIKNEKNETLLYAAIKRQTFDTKTIDKLIDNGATLETPLNKLLADVKDQEKVKQLDLTLKLTLSNIKHQKLTPAVLTLTELYTKTQPSEFYRFIKAISDAQFCLSIRLPLLIEIFRYNIFLTCIRSDTYFFKNVLSLVPHNNVINMTYLSKDTPLHLIAQHKNAKADCIQEMIAKGANTLALNANNKTPLTVALESNAWGAIYALITPQSEPKLQLEYGELLLKAIIENETNCAIKLIQLGANLKAKTQQHEDALDLAIRRNNLQLINLLLVKGQDPTAKPAVYTAMEYKEVTPCTFFSFIRSTRAYLNPNPTWQNKSAFSLGIEINDAAKVRVLLNYVALTLSKEEVALLREEKSLEFKRLYCRYQLLHYQNNKASSILVSGHFKPKQHSYDRLLADAASALMLEEEKINIDEKCLKQLKIDHPILESDPELTAFYTDLIMMTPLKAKL